ncbi:MAG: hypothetical protein WBD07_10800 [Vicinamibacterales bacterium]
MLETGSDSTAVKAAANPGNGPDLRREFVGIMFALAVGEVGLQTAALVQAGNTIRYLPAYSHLFLALFVIAASWVGWSRTKVASARKDVHELFEWAFVVLLLDTAMVVTYFILVRTVDFSDANCRIDPAAQVAFWHVFIFALYLAWDGVTKVAMYPKPEGAGWWHGWRQLDPEKLREQQQTMKRAWPTLVCLASSIVLWRVFAAFDPKHEHLLAADLALLSVVLLFRALKGVIPGPTQTAANIAWNKRWVVGLSATFVIGTFLSVFSIPLPLWQSLQEIRTPIACSAASAVQ